MQSNVITNNFSHSLTLLSPPSPVDILGQFPGLLKLVFVSSAGLVQRLGPVSDDTDVGAEVVFLGRGGQGEGVPLQPGNGRTLDRDVLTHLHTETFPLHLQLQSFGRMHHHLGARYGVMITTHQIPYIYTICNLGHSHPGI